MNDDSTSSRRSVLRGILVVLVVVVGSALVLHTPDAPIPHLVPGSSSGPAFAVQVIRPRGGLPLGGVLPPGWFGVDEELGFDSASADAEVVCVGPRRVELRADGWELVLDVDEAGRPTQETYLEFPLVFEERERAVRCRPGDPAVGGLVTTRLDASGVLAGSFELELAHCEDAASGEPLGWPPRPFVLRGSFDRLPLEDAPR